MVERHPNFAAGTVKNDEEHHPWDRMPKEPIKAYACFCQYRDMRPRSVKVLAKALGRRSTRRLEQWCSRWEWIKRAEAYEEHLDRKWRETKAGEIELVSKNLKSLLKKARWIINEELAARMEKVMGQKALKKRDPKAERETVLADPNFARLLKDTVTLSRLLIGESTEMVESKADFDPSKLSVEELAELRRLQNKAKKQT